MLDSDYSWSSRQRSSHLHTQAAELQASVERETIEFLGALPLLLPILDKLRLYDLIKEQCDFWDSSKADIDWGVMAEVLVLNRLLAPKPLVHVETWLQQTAIPHLFKLDAEQANDDRLARTLDQIYPHLDVLWQKLIVRAVSAFDLDLSRLGYDITSVSFCGEYDDAELIRYGYSRDHRQDRKQLELATTTILEGGVPLYYRVLAGNVADSTTPVENLARLRSLLALLPEQQRKHPIVVSDRAMLGIDAVRAYSSGDFRFVGPLDPAVGDGAVRKVLENVSRDELLGAPLAYRPQRASRDPAFEPYCGVERQMEIPAADDDESGKSLSLRAVVIYTPAKARLDEQVRRKHIEQLEDDLGDLSGKIGRRPYTTEKTVSNRVKTLLHRNRARPFVHVEVGLSSDASNPLPTLSWHRDEKALAAAAALDGRYVLGTNHPTLSINEILTESKRRDVPEKRYETLKGPLSIRPVYLHSQERILALIFLTMVALLVYSIVELLIRRRGHHVTARRLLQQFEHVMMIVTVMSDGSSRRRLAVPPPGVVDILQRLGFPNLDDYVAGFV